MAHSNTTIYLIAGGVVLLGLYYIGQKNSTNNGAPSTPPVNDPNTYRGFTLYRSGASVPLNSAATGHIDTLLAGGTLAASDYSTLQSDGTWVPALPANGKGSSSSSSSSSSTAADIGQALAVAAAFI